MLEPQSRAALTDQLAPPPGYELAHAVGTTFTLDLATALSVPLSFASRRISSDAGSLGVLDAVRRAADRLDVFAQAGEIGLSTPSDLVAFLEESIHPVLPARGLFHPKVWFLEYREIDGDALAHRFLCASRNLTSDRSWDVVIRLDGAPADPGRRRDATARNAPLVRLLRALPDLAVRPLPVERRSRLADLADRWRTVDLEPPREMKDLTFHVFGIGRRPVLDIRGPRALVISPFVTDGGLAALRAGVHGPTHLVSRPETLDALALSSLDAHLATFVLDDGSFFPDDGDAAESPSARPADRLLSGLHAKVIVVDRHDGAHVILGSANATDAALRSNVEVMVELTAPAPRFGVAATLEALGALVEPYETDGGAVPDPDEEAERALESCLHSVAGVALTVRLIDGEPFGLEVWADGGAPRLDDGVTLRWHLLTRHDIGGVGLPGSAEEPSVHSIQELADVTPFLVLTARDARGRERRTVALATLIDDLPQRRDAVIARQLTDTASFVRLLTLLLELQGIALPSAEADGTGADGFFGQTGGVAGAGLFEALVRAVGARHSGLQDVRRLVDYLGSTDGSSEVLPPGFEELWSSVWAAHESLTELAKGEQR